jgi:hypothetical protein
MKKNHRAPRAGRPLAKPNYSRKEMIRQNMQRVAAEYLRTVDGIHPSLAAIANKTNLNPIKVRKLLITAGVYQSAIADKVLAAFERHKAEMPYKEALLATAAEMKLSRASVTSYLPYEKVVYMKKNCDPAEISVNAERMRLYRDRNAAVKKLHKAMEMGEQVEACLWDCIVRFQGFPFYTATGLPFQYTLKKGRHDGYTKELWVNRMENGKPLVWSSVWMAFEKASEMTGEVDRPKAIGNIRGISYIYPILWRFGMIKVPEKIALKMKRNQPKQADEEN